MRTRGRSGVVQCSSTPPCARSRRLHVCFQRRLHVSNIRTFSRHTRRCFERTHEDVFSAHVSRSPHITTHAHTSQHTQTTHRTSHTVTPSTHTDITITRGSNGPSTRVPWVTLNTSFGSHVSHVCASSVVLGTLLQSLLSTLLKLGVRMQGLLLGCAVISLLWCKSQFSSTQSQVCKPLHDSQQLVRCLRVGKSLVRAALRIGRRCVQVASTQASTSENESTKVCVPLAQGLLVDLLARKVVLWITPSGGKDAQAAVRRQPSRPVGRWSV